MAASQSPFAEPPACSLVGRRSAGAGGWAPLCCYRFSVDFYVGVVAFSFFQEAPTNKLLYAKDIPTYKEEVKSYYKAIRDLPPLSSLEMEEFLTQESKVSSLKPEISFYVVIFVFISESLHKLFFLLETRK